MSREFPTPDGRSDERSLLGFSSIGTALVLLVASGLYWRFRITGGPNWQLLTNDISFEHYPMVSYGFGLLRDGRLPVWNPFELCGSPFLAVPYVGIFYPGNLPYLFLDAATAIEVVYVLHVAFAGFCMWLLARTVDLGRAGAWAAAATVMWSGAMMSGAQLPNQNVTMCWLPLTVLLIEKALRGSGAALVGLAFSVAFQLMGGATEIFIYNMYTGALFTIFGLGWMMRREGPAQATTRGSLVLAAVGAGFLLSAVQLVPTMEMVQESVRWGGEHTVAWGRGVFAGAWFPPSTFLSNAITVVGHVHVGFLPLLLAFGFGARRSGRIWWFALTAGILAALLVFGGTVFELYFQTPIGGMFRKPSKLLHIYAFAQALMAGIVVSRLMEWRNTGLAGWALWQKPAWWVGVGAPFAALVWISLQWRGGEGSEAPTPIDIALHALVISPYLLGGLLLLLVYSFFPRRSLRAVVVVALLLLQVASLYFGAQYLMPRPFDRQSTYDQQSEFLGNLKVLVGSQRVFLSRAFHGSESLTSKQGLLTGMRTVGGYLPLLSRRQAAYLHRAGKLARSAKVRGLAPRDLAPPLHEKTEHVAKLLHTTARQTRKPGFRKRSLEGSAHNVALYEQVHALPRAFFVPRARLVDSPEEALDAISAPGFSKRGVVVIEPGGPAVRERELPASVPTPASIRIDGPERVVVEIDAPTRGFLVLSDTYSRGWRAFTSGAELPIYRANYLFRAVPVEVGPSTVSFEYHSPGLRLGMGVSAATAVARAPRGGWTVWRRRTTR
jgi:hypothetical protein